LKEKIKNHLCIIIIIITIIPRNGKMIRHDVTSCYVLWWGEEKEDRHDNVNLAGQDGEKTGIIHTKQKKKNSSPNPQNIILEGQTTVVIII